MKKILIVDDNPELARSISEYVSGITDWQATVAHSAERALELFHQVQFDVILSDIQMPGMDGLEFAEKLKEAFESAEIENAEWQRPLVILMTGTATDGVIEEAMALGVTAVLEKPFSPRELTALLES